MSAATRLLFALLLCLGAVPACPAQDDVDFTGVVCTRNSPKNRVTIRKSDGGLVEVQFDRYSAIAFRDPKRDDRWLYSRKLGIRWLPNNTPLEVTLRRAEPVGQVQLIRVMTPREAAERAAERREAAIAEAKAAETRRREFAQREAARRRQLVATQARQSQSSSNGPRLTRTQVLGFMVKDFMTLAEKMGAVDRGTSVGQPSPSSTGVSVTVYNRSGDRYTGKMYWMKDASTWHTANVKRGMVTLPIRSNDTIFGNRLLFKDSAGKEHRRDITRSGGRGSQLRFDCLLIKSGYVARN